MGTKYDPLDLPKHIAEGNADETLRRRAAYEPQQGTLPAFIRMVILDVISDPATLDSAKLSHYEHDLQVSNIKYAAVAPRNSIIARRAMGGDSVASERVMVLYPFFPPHLAMPAKPGEHVWAMFENTDAKANELGYWMCRIVQPNFVEDANYTHADRQFDASFVPGLSDVFEGSDDPKYEFPNGAVDAKKGERYTVAGTASLPEAETSYEDLLTQTDAAKLTRYEPVPRYRKRPADLALEGSNNTLVVLGTDRSGPVADYDADPDLGMVPKPPTGDVAGQGTGAIDIVVGRGQTPETGGKPVANKLGNNELGKSRKDLSAKEGDVDYATDRSRVLVAQRVPVDARFNLKGYNTGTGVGSGVTDAADGDGAIVVKTDKLRLIARSDVEIIVMGFTRDSNGRMVDKTDASGFASIVIKADGSIVIVPSASGVIKLGGDDADLAVLCTKVNNAGAGGNVVAQPIVDTMGGAQGAADGLNGTFSTKVLLK